MRVDVLSAPGIRAWDNMPATDSETHLEKNGAENGLSDTGSKSLTGATNGARVKDKTRPAVDKVFWHLRGSARA